MAWPYTFAALAAPQLSYLDSNFADAAQLGTAVNFSGIGGTTPGTGAFTTLSATGAASVGGGLTVTGALGCAGGYAAPGGTVGLTFETSGAASLPVSATIGTAANAANSLVAIGGAANVYTSVIRQNSTTGGGLVAFENYATTVAGSITLGSGLNSVAYNTTSDAALKTLHGPADGTVLASLPVREASFTSAPQLRRPMLIAQEVAVVCPWAVREGDGTPAKPSMIDHGALVPALLAYAQSLEARIATLEAAAKIAAPSPTAAAIACRAAVALASKLPVMLAAFARGTISQGGTVAAP